MFKKNTAFRVPYFKGKKCLSVQTPFLKNVWSYQPEIHIKYLGAVKKSNS